MCAKMRSTKVFVYLQMVQARCVRRQRVARALQFTVAGAAYPKFAHFFVLRVEEAVGVHKFDGYLDERHHIKRKRPTTRYRGSKERRANC